MSVCHFPSPDKEAYLTDVGEQLVQEHGKKKYYRPGEVKGAHRRSRTGDPLDFACWAMSAFCSHEDFDAYHRQQGESCDYTSMKREMLGTFAVSDDSDWFSLPDWELDASWLDLGDFCDGLLEGLGEFIGGLFDPS